MRYTIIEAPTVTNGHNLNQAESLWHGDEGFGFADAGYRGAEKRGELKEIEVDWHITERPGKVRTLKKNPRINKVLTNIETMKADVRAKVQHHQMPVWVHQDALSRYGQ